MDEIPSHITIENSLMRCQSCLSGLEGFGGIREKTHKPAVHEIHKINDVEWPAGR